MSGSNVTNVKQCLKKTRKRLGGADGRTAFK